MYVQNEHAVKVNMISHIVFKLFCLNSVTGTINIRKDRQTEICFRSRVFACVCFFLINTMAHVCDSTGATAAATMAAGAVVQVVTVLVAASKT